MRRTWHPPGECGPGRKECYLILEGEAQERLPGGGDGAFLSLECLPQPRGEQEDAERANQRGRYVGEVSPVSVARREPPGAPVSIDLLSLLLPRWPVSCALWPGLRGSGAE